MEPINPLVLFISIGTVIVLLVVGLAMAIMPAVESAEQHAAFLNSEAYLDANIVLATHETQVQGLVAHESTVFPAGWMYSFREVHRRIANEAVLAGAHDVIIYLEVITSPHIGQSHGTYRATMYLLPTSN